MRYQWFLVVILLFLNIYSISTLTTKPAYWYDEAINVELAHNFADYGKLDIVVAPEILSGKGSTVGSTGYPVTVPLAGFFKLFGFGLAQSRLYMLLWMNALVLIFFFVARRLWGKIVASYGTLFFVTFAPFYANGRSVMGEIPGFLFFLLSFYFFECRRYLYSGLLLGLAVVSKPSVFVFLIPSFSLAILFSRFEFKERLKGLALMALGSLSALLPWFAIYWSEIVGGGIFTEILDHFKNPYEEAGASVASNIATNLPTLFTSETLLYMFFLTFVIALVLFLRLENLNRNLVIIFFSYTPLIMFQYLKSFGYLRYLIAAELIAFIMFTMAFPSFLRALGAKLKFDLSPPKYVHLLFAIMLLFQLTHMFFFSDLYYSRKAQNTVSHLSEFYAGEIIGVHNLPQVGSLLPADKKYQYLSTYGLWDFGVDPFVLPFGLRPDVIVTNSIDPRFSILYTRESNFKEGYYLYIKNEI